MVRQFVLTLNAGVQRLSTLLVSQGVAGPEDVPVKAISLQPGAANANPVFLGDGDVSTTVYGVRLEAAAAGVPPAPFVLGEFDRVVMRLSDFYVRGTNAEKLHVLAVMDV